ncbi:MAG: hypothetical protein NWF10_00500 [Candidatus Bathyarchaeota archaeon]|jgi:hypothetical protein|nr:hypothetical protein [Candidatus Bathyarchaeota archaeon]
MTGERDISIILRIIISVIGTFIILALTTQMDDFNFAIMLFLLLFIAVSVTDKD